MTMPGLAETIMRDIHALCDPGDRHPGTERNRAATRHAEGRMRECGLAIERLEFDVPEWLYGTSGLAVGGLRLPVNPGPFSTAVDETGPLVVVRDPDDLGRVVEPGAVLLVCDELAAEQLTPRDYPFYTDPGHAAILDALEAARPRAIIAATDRSAMTAAMSPFPLIEEAGFSMPHGYVHSRDSARLAAHAGQPTHVLIDSETRPSSGVQLIGRLEGTDPSAGTVVVCAHIDSKPDTPGALDNAAGVAVLLAVADLLAGRRTGPSVEFVPFNGEDHAMAPGELAYLEARPELTDVRLAINIDAPGLNGASAAYSGYGLSKAAEARVASLAEGFPEVTAGPEWPASDHMVFAMRGVPAMAFTSSDLETVLHTYAHTARDVPEIVDADILAGTARFIAELVAAHR